jgi:hypothetical protein
VRLVACVSVAVAASVLAVFSVPPGRASGDTVGDGCLVVTNGFGRISFTLTRGVVFGRFAEGTVKIDDLDETDSTTPKVYNATQVKVGEHRYSYTGNLVRFRTSGPVRININAQFIDLSVVGKGSAVLWANSFDVLDNLFSVDASSFCEEGFQELPLKPTRFPIAAPADTTP